MKRVAVVVAVAGIALAIWYLRRPHRSVAAPEPAASSTPTAQQPSAQHHPIDHVTQLASPAERKQLADQIAAAQAARHSASSSGGAAATHAPAAPRLPENLDDDGHPIAISKTQIRDAMHEVIPLITKCYETAIPTLPDPNITVTAKFRLSGDPDVGPLIDTDALENDDGKPLPAKFDDCMRTTLMSLALPPLAEGDQIEIHYPFRFSTQ